MRLRAGAGAPRERASAVRLAAEGLQNLDIGQRLGVDRETAARWRRRRLTARVRALEAAQRSSRPGRIPEERFHATTCPTACPTAKRPG
ncbi:MAG: helix-turn-helix domain-containing protein [Thermoplasmata archaeon]|nr:helix-turn-helix domain-containing protein [Thermoplasmata archaeon]